MIIQRGLFQHIYHIGCAFNLHSIIDNGLIPGGQDSSRRQTVFFLPTDPRDKDHQDPEHIDFSVPRRAQYVHSAWKKHQDAVFWVDIDLAIRKGLTFYQTRSNANILQGTLPAYCIPKVVRLKTGEVLYEKSYMSPLDHHERSHYDTITIGPEGMMNWALQLNNSQSVNSFNSLVEKFNMKRSPNLPNQNPNQSVIDRGNLIAQKMCLLLKVKRPVPTRSDEKGLHEELGSSDRSGKPEKLSENTRVKQAHDGTGQPVERNSSSAHTVKEQFAPEENRDIASFNTDNEFNRASNEENIDFNIPGLPHSAVKQSHGVNVQNLI